MFYVYLLRSISNPGHTYIGFTRNLQDRLKAHNSSGSFHTAGYGPWKIVTFLRFNDKEKALEFERYLKSASGRVFAKKRLW